MKTPSPQAPSNRISHRAQVPPAMAGSRLDQAAAALFPDYSRARLQVWLKSGELRLNGAPAPPKQKLCGGEWLELEAIPESQGEWRAEARTLDIVHEDATVLVLNKPAGLVVHPAAGNPAGTLLNALLHHCPELASVPRAGIVHRLDKDTTGLMVVAKTLSGHSDLVRQLQARSVGREYEAVAFGRVPSGGTVDRPIGRHPRQRKKMAVLARGGKPAVTHYEILEAFPNHTHLALQLETGRTHQIRVHMQQLGYPLVGDATYGGRRRAARGQSPVVTDALAAFPRQALHARRLRLIHPESGAPLAWEAPLPADLQELLHVLREDARRAV